MNKWIDAEIIPQTKYLYSDYSEVEVTGYIYDHYTSELVLGKTDDNEYCLCKYRTFYYRDPKPNGKSKLVCASWHKDDIHGTGIRIVSYRFLDDILE